MIGNQFIKNFYLYKPLEETKYLEQLEQLENYLAQKIWVTKLDSFNDPFEGSFKFAPFNFSNLKEADSAVFKFFFNSFKKEHPQATEEEFIIETTKEEFLSQHYSTSNQIVSLPTQMGAVCLTASYSNIPMWAHYANEHAGYCLIFQLDFNSVMNKIGFFGEKKKEHFENILAGNEIISWSFDYGKKSVFEFIFLKVKYDLEIGVIDLLELRKIESEHERNKYSAQKSFGVKCRQWEYEEEYRLIVNQNSKDGGLIYLPTYADFLKVTGIIVGEKLNDTPTFKSIETLSKKYSVNLYQTVCSKEKYEINRLQLF